jgi:hypothetical protein
VRIVVNGVFSGGILDDGTSIALPKLAATAAIDTPHRRALLEYIDNLVYCLYMDIEIDAVGFREAERIRRLCSRSPYFGQLIQPNETD